MRSKLVNPIASLVIVAICAGCVGHEDLESVTFMAGFKPQASLPFVGVYVAKELGYFEEVGLNVDIQHSSGGGDNLQLLATGEVDVTTQDAAVLLQRRSDPGIPLVSIGLIGQQGQQAYVALADSGIMTPSDWVGRRVGFKGTPPPDLFAILEAVDVDPSEVIMVNVGFDPRILTEGQVDVYPVFKSNEPYVLESLGFDLRMWDAVDYGAPTLGLAYVTTESTIAGRPEMLSAFMSAAIRGIEYAEDQPDRALDIIMDYVGDESERDHQAHILQAELRAAHNALTDANGLGWQTLEQWSTLADFLVNYDALPGEIDVAKAFTTRFLPNNG